MRDLAWLERYRKLEQTSESFQPRKTILKRLRGGSIGSLAPRHRKVRLRSSQASLFSILSKVHSSVFIALRRQPIDDEGLHHSGSGGDAARHRNRRQCFLIISPFLWKPPSWRVSRCVRQSKGVRGEGHQR